MPTPPSVAAKHPLQATFELLRHLGEPGEWIWMTQKAWAEDPETPWTMEQRLEYLQMAIRYQRSMLHSDRRRFFRHVPVDVQTFIECPKLMNKRKVVWPEVMPYLRGINDGSYTECVLTGGIGVAKTTIALYTQAYQLYLLSSMQNPHRVFDLDPASEIITVFQSISKNLANDVDYRRFREMLSSSTYFEQRFPYSRDRESDMRFPHNIYVKPVAGHDQAAIGQNVIGGILDEVNFMAVVEKSKLSMDGSTYDQAVQNYNAIAMRRESRFMSKGWVPGMLCLVSSRNYPGQFTDLKEKEAREQTALHGRTRIYVYDKRLWELRPDRFSPERFKVFVGSENRKPAILSGSRDDVSQLDERLIIEIPVDYLPRFQADLLGALRDVAGVSTLALHPFIIDTAAVASGFGRIKSVLSADDTDFTTKLFIHPDRFVRPEEPRFAHIDTSLSGDSSGMAVGWVPGFKGMQRGDQLEMLPFIHYDLVLEIRPPRNGEIEFEHIRRLLYKLREVGLNIKWVSFDTFQSADSIQMLRQRRFIVGTQSMDDKPIAYEILKQAFYDGRVRAPVHTKAQAELVRLERDPKTRKIDHPARGSKDCSDAMAGVATGLTLRREIWVRHGIPLTTIPRSIVKAAEQAGKGSVADAERAGARARLYAEPEAV